MPSSVYPVTDIQTWVCVIPVEARGQLWISFLRGHLLLSTPFFETGTLQGGLELTQKARLAGQQGSGIGIRSMYYYVHIFLLIYFSFYVY